MFVIWCTWIITIIFRFNIRELIVSKFNFLTRVLSIVARLVEESRATFHFDNWDVHIKSCTNVFICFLLKYPKVKRIAPSWSHLPKHLIFDLTGQVQAAAIISSNFLINWTYNKIIKFIFYWRFFFRMNQGRIVFEIQINFEVPHPVHEYTKMRIPSKRYQTNTVHTFWGTCSASALRYLGEKGVACSIKR